MAVTQAVTIRTYCLVERWSEACNGLGNTLRGEQGWISHNGWWSLFDPQLPLEILSDSAESSQSTNEGAVEP